MAADCAAIHYAFDGATFIVSSDVAPYSYTFQVNDLAEARTWNFTGIVQSAPQSVCLQIDDVGAADVFWNQLAIRPASFDLDGDEVPNDWEEAMGADPHVDDAAEDPDGDGVPTINEYVADTHSTNGQLFLQAENITFQSPVAVGFDVSTDRVYTLQRIDDLRGSDWADVPGSIDHVGLGLDDVLFDTNPPVVTRHYRLKVRLPP